MGETGLAAIPPGVTPLSITAYSLAERYLGIREFAGGLDHPLIQWWLSLCGFGLHSHDEVPWCGAYVFGAAVWPLRLQAPTFPARARYWLTVGQKVEPGEALVGFDLVILARGGGDQPDASVLDAPGHVGWFAGYSAIGPKVLGGNQADHVSILNFPADRVLGIRRLVA